MFKEKSWDKCDVKKKITRKEWWWKNLVVKTKFLELVVGKKIKRRGLYSSAYISTLHISSFMNKHLYKLSQSLFFTESYRLCMTREREENENVWNIHKKYKSLMFYVECYYSWNCLKFEIFCCGRKSCFCCYVLAFVF